MAIQKTFSPPAREGGEGEGGLISAKNHVPRGTSTTDGPNDVPNPTMNVPSKSTDPRTILLIMAGKPWLIRRAVQGITVYARENTTWELVLLTPEGTGSLPTLEQFHARGAILALSPHHLKSYLNIPQPLVLLDSLMVDTDRPKVVLDNAEVGLMAARYYQNKGYRQFAYVSSGKIGVDGRCLAFVKAVQAMGETCQVLPNGMRIKERDFEEVMVELRDWLTTLPKPTGMLVCNDQHAALVLQACRLLGIRVPEDLAVMGVHDDALYCHLGYVPLSSIALAGEKMGYHAAALLDQQLQGLSQRGVIVGFPPVGVITRRSTDAMAVEDPMLQEALNWISAHLHEELDLEVMLEHIPTSRSTLERRFKQLLGRTPYEEVLRQRIERARTLLVDTEWTLEEIAQRCGFSGRVYFGNAFKHHTGISPAAFRAQHVRPMSWR